MENKLLDPFSNIANIPLQDTEFHGNEEFSNLRLIRAGAGDTAFTAGKDGIWLGSRRYSDAPFRVSKNGALIAQSATFQDANDVTIIDSQGIVSTAAFINASYQANNQISVSSTSYGDVSGSSLSFTLGRAAKVLISFTGIVTFSTTDNLGHGVNLTIAIDGTTESSYPPEAFAIFNTGTIDVNIEQTLSYTKIYDFSSGAHTIKLQWRSLKSADLVYMTNRTLNYLVLGK